MTVRDVRCTRCDSVVQSDGRVCRRCGTVVRRSVVPVAEVVDLDATVDVSTLRATAAQTVAVVQPGQPIDQVPVGGFDLDPSGPLIGAAEVDGVQTPAPARAAIDLAGMSGTVDRSWSARWGRGLELTKLSFGLIRSQPGLLWVPINVVAAILVILLLDVVVAAALPSVLGLVLTIVVLVSMATVAVVGQAVIIHRVGVTAEGGVETNRAALTAVLPRLWTFAAWSCVSLTVGIAIRSLERGRGPFGLVLRIVAMFINVAWSAMTFFVVPVILYEGLPLRPAIRRSRELLRVSWGEGFVGVGLMAVFFNLIGLGTVIVIVLLTFAHLYILAGLLLLIAVVGINLLSAVATPVFTFVLYRYASTGELTFGFEARDIAAAFRQRRTMAAVGRRSI